MPEDDLFEKRRAMILKLMTRVGPINGRTRLQKMVFLAQEELGFPQLFEFKKHHYGPYSWDLTETIERMIVRGDIEEQVETQGDTIRYIYSVKDNIKEPASPDISEKALDVLEKLSKIPLHVLLEYVYRKYLTCSNRAT